jgi:exonuclease III
MMSKNLNLNIVQWNCNGFFNHFNEFKILIQKYDSFAFCIQETRFSQ